MKIFKWLTSKTGKLPITMAQAAGLTAVVGAAGVAAFNFLSSPAEDNSSFVPPSAYEQSNVVYVAQGPGNYDAQGAVGSSFKVLPSKSIQLANQQELQMRQAQELEGFNAQPTFEEPSSGFDGKARQLSGGEMGLGMGSNKQVGNSFELLKNVPNQLNGLNDIIAQAQAEVNQAGAQTPGAQAPGKPGAAGDGSDGKSAPTLASVPRNWGNGGATRAGGSGGISNTFVVQNSNKNKGDVAAGKPVAADMAQAGDAIAQARAAMTKLQEGEQLRARANFGPSDRLSGGRDASVLKGRNVSGRGGAELSRIHKHMAKLHASNTLHANAVAEPYMAGEKLSSGLVVDTDNVVIGQQGNSSGDLGRTRAQMKGIQRRLNQIQAKFEERTTHRHEIRKWIWWALPLALVMIPIIGTLMSLSRIYLANLNPVIHALGWACRIAAYVFAALTLFPIYKLIESSISYANKYGGDGWSTFAGIFGGVLGAGVGAALLIPQVSAWLAKLPLVTLKYALLAGAGGAGLFEFLSNKGDGYSAEELDDNMQKEDEETEETNEEQEDH